MDISCRVMFSSNRWNKKVGSTSSFWRKRQFFSLNSLVFVEDLPSYESGGTRVRANHAKKMMRRKDAQSNCSLSM